MRRQAAVIVGGILCVAGLGLTGAGPGERALPAANAVARLPESLRPAVSAAFGASEGRFAIDRSRGTAVARGGGLLTTFQAGGPRIGFANGSLSLRLVAAGRAGGLTTAMQTEPVVARNEVSYRRGNLTEWYRNGPLGLEQGFTLRSRPAGRGRLMIALRTAGTIRLEQTSSGLALVRREGATIGRYGDLSALDATGKALPARLELAGRTLRVRVDDAGARYPLTIDPFIQQGAKLGATGASSFGTSVALSADGTVALVGSSFDDAGVGAAYGFVRSGSTWAQQGDKLTGAGEVGKGRFGSSVALSADGNTAIVGAYSDNGAIGAFWTFVRAQKKPVSVSNETLKRGSSQLTPPLGAFPVTWQQIGQKVTPSDEIGTGFFGLALALGADGKTAIVGGKGDHGFIGAAWTFTRSGSTWTQGGKLTGAADEVGPASFGQSVALSADASTALIGGLNDGTGGAAWVFTLSGGTWKQQGNKLTSGVALGGAFGISVALSADGNTALVGAETDDQFKGAAWAFTRTGLAWSHQGGKLTSGEAPPPGVKVGFGTDVALSADGNTALIGAPGDVGAAFAFTRSGSTWTEAPGRIAASDEIGKGRFGSAVALSADGNTGLFGGPEDASNAGAAWVFVGAPAVTSISPSSGPVAGGTAVTINGSNFGGTPSVRFGATPAKSVAVVSASQLTAVSPAGVAGAVDVIVTTSGGPSGAGTPDRFTYIAPATTTTATTPTTTATTTTATPGADKQPPSAPGILGGTFAGSTLVLRWSAAHDNVRVGRYVLYERGKPLKRIAGNAIRLSIPGFHTKRPVTLVLRAFDAAGNQGPASPPIRIVLAPKPEGVPAQIPSWSLALLLWQENGRHGKRPATPALPSWYGRWKAWQLAPYLITR